MDLTAVLAALGLCVMIVWRLPLAVALSSVAVFVFALSPQNLEPSLLINRMIHVLSTNAMLALPPLMLVAVSLADETNRRRSPVRWLSPISLMLLMIAAISGLSPVALIGAALIPAVLAMVASAGLLGGMHDPSDQRTMVRSMGAPVILLIPLGLGAPLPAAAALTAVFAVSADIMMRGRRPDWEAAWALMTTTMTRSGHLLMTAATAAAVVWVVSYGPIPLADRLEMDSVAAPGLMIGLTVVLWVVMAIAIGALPTALVLALGISPIARGAGADPVVLAVVCMLLMVGVNVLAGRGVLIDRRRGRRGFNMQRAGFAGACAVLAALTWWIPTVMTAARGLLD